MQHTLNQVNGEALQCVQVYVYVAQGTYHLETNVLAKANMQ